MAYIYAPPLGLAIVFRLGRGRRKSVTSPEHLTTVDSWYRFPFCDFPTVWHNVTVIGFLVLCLLLPDCLQWWLILLCIGNVLYRFHGIPIHVHCLHFEITDFCQVGNNWKVSTWEILQMQEWSWTIGMVMGNYRKNTGGNDNADITHTHTHTHAHTHTHTQCYVSMSWCFSCHFLRSNNWSRGIIDLCIWLITLGMLYSTC